MMSVDKTVIKWIYTLVLSSGPAYNRSTKNTQLLSEKQNISAKILFPDQKSISTEVAFESFDLLYKMHSWFVKEIISLISASRYQDIRKYVLPQREFGSNIIPPDGTLSIPETQNSYLVFLAVTSYPTVPANKQFCFTLTPISCTIILLSSFLTQYNKQIHIHPCRSRIACRLN